MQFHHLFPLAHQLRAYQLWLSPRTECGDERLCVARVCYYGMGVGWDWDWDGDPWGGLPVWPEMAIPTLKHKGLGYVGDPTSGGDPRMGRGDPRIYKKILKIKSSTLDF